jgi:hypothetical protein
MTASGWSGFVTIPVIMVGSSVVSVVVQDARIMAVTTNRLSSNHTIFLSIDTPFLFFYLLV